MVVPPPADEVIDYEDLEDPVDFSEPEPEELINALR
ncbi:UTP--glucose-1-phosphate uridylyltransferase [Streptosporangium minutum]|nr:UTP--glucose-1-phosphate uridylyltransferase [Streptosporangium minutum]